MGFGKVIITTHSIKFARVVLKPSYPTASLHLQQVELDNKIQEEHLVQMNTMVLILIKTKIINNI